MSLVLAAVLHPASEDHRGFIHGRVTTDDGATSEGRLRWGGDEEAFWGDHFNGARRENAWAIHVPPDELPFERHSIRIFGIELVNLKNRLDLGRPFMARFGDIERIEARGRNIRVTLKSGSVFNLDRFAADDLADGVRVWDPARGIVDIDEWRIRTIEFLPAFSSGAAPYRLHGTVRTRHHEFTGFIQWDRQAGVETDTLDGPGTDPPGLRFGAIRSIERRSRDGSLVTLLDGREIGLIGTGGPGRDHSGMYVDDRRYGRVLVPWDTFERVDFSPGGVGPAYGDFRPGHPLRGRVTTRDGRWLEGRLVYDLDESETTETLDAPGQGVHYNIPFGLIASLIPPGREGHGADARVVLHAGEELQLEPAGDLGETNAGLLVFIDGQQDPEYVPWADVARIDLDRPPTMHPPLGGH